MITLGKKVVVSDPCYDFDTVSRYSHVLDIRPGNYITKVEVEDERNKSLMVIHEDYLELKNSMAYWEPKSRLIGVDSGQAGIFDYDTYRNDDHPIDTPEVVFNEPFNDDGEGEPWYRKMCHLTLETKNDWGEYDRGVVSSSGWGDGCYEVYIAKWNDEIVGIKIIFIEEDVDVYEHTIGYEDEEE